jgi:hypothetical protein
LPMGIAELEVNDKPGTIKFKDADKKDQVYINGVNRGSIEHLSEIDLRPGTYEIMVMDNGREVLDRTVTLSMDQTITLRVGDRS